MTKKKNACDAYQVDAVFYFDPLANMSKQVACDARLPVDAICAATNRCHLNLIQRTCQGCVFSLLKRVLSKLNGIRNGHSIILMLRQR